MQIFEIENLKNFMNSLLVQEKYDSFYLHEARIKTNLDYYINGKVNYDYYSSDELEAAEERTEYIVWKDIKKNVYDLIKGERLPLRFKLVLMFNRDNIERLLEMNNVPLRLEEVGALFMNIIYEEGKLTVTTGTSMKTFTLDKTLEILWDDTVNKYYIE